MAGRKLVDAMVPKMRDRFRCTTRTKVVLRVVCEFYDLDGSNELKCINLSGRRSRFASASPSSYQSGMGHGLLLKKKTSLDNYSWPGKAAGYCSMIWDAREQSIGSD